MKPASHLTSCQGKRSFESFPAAQAAAKRQRQHRDDARSAPYHCQHCNAYHVGNLNRKAPRPTAGTTAGWIELYKPSEEDL